DFTGLPGGSARTMPAESMDKTAANDTAMVRQYVRRTRDYFTHEGLQLVAFHFKRSTRLVVPRFAKSCEAFKPVHRSSRHEPSNGLAP
ncbi:MAG: hypothetical protein WAK08_03390, partial [Pseudolabrys sp.]